MKRRFLISAGILGLAIASHAKAKDAAPSGMVWIPGGEYVMGTDDPKSMPNEHPAHRVKVDGFWMDTNDVTNAQLRSSSRPPATRPSRNARLTGRN